MKITPNLLSIPPYISTTWDNITSLQVNGSFLTLHLKDGAVAQVPNLSQTELAAIFEAHTRYSEKGSSTLAKKSPLDSPYSFSLPLRPEDGSLIENLGSGMQHNPDQSTLDPLPPEALKKIVAIARAFGLEDLSTLSPPEPECNCMYCQVTRALLSESAPQEEEVTEADLTFRNWEVKQTADKLYLVINPLDENEHYNVYLGEPLGCTCGHHRCEHIRAVLNT
jgi:hypothetical protein